jgi:hypothetical protein
MLGPDLSPTHLYTKLAVFEPREFHSLELVPTEQIYPIPRRNCRTVFETSPGIQFCSGQGCQMVYFHSKNKTNLGIPILEGL